MVGGHRRCIGEKCPVAGVPIHYTTTLEPTAEHIIEVNGVSQLRASGLRAGLLTVARHISYAVMSPRTFAPEYVALRRRGPSQSVVPWQQRCAITTHARAEHTRCHTPTHAHRTNGSAHSYARAEQPHTAATPRRTRTA